MSLATDVIAVRGEDGQLHCSAFHVYYKLPSSDRSVVQWLLSRSAVQQLRGTIRPDAAAEEAAGSDGAANTFARTLLSTIGVVPAQAPPRSADEEEQAEQRQAEQQLVEEVAEAIAEQDRAAAASAEEEQEEQGERKGVEVYVNGTHAPSLEMVVDAKGQCAFAATGTAQPAPSAMAGLQLRPGQNDLLFKYDSTMEVVASLWLWDAHDTVIVSDIDGTISASDVRGYINTVHLQRYEHTHSGVCRLYSHLAEAHGGRFLYLTSRPLSLLPATRAYIKGAVQDGHRLPDGPIICSPYSMAKVLYKELIEKSIKAFKQQALLDVADVFHRAGRPGSRPVFAAGFGNKTQDALAYLGAHVPSDAICIINTRSEVRLHAHMAAAEEEEAAAAEEDDEGGEEGVGGRLRGYRSRLQGLRRQIPAAWLGGGGGDRSPSASPPLPVADEQQLEEQDALERQEEQDEQPPPPRPLEAVASMTMSRGGSIDGEDELFASASSALPPTTAASYPAFSSYGDERLLRILESVLARDKAPCHDAQQPPAPPAASRGDETS